MGLLSKPRSAVMGEVDSHFWSGWITERDIVVGDVASCGVGGEAACPDDYCLSIHGKFGPENLPPTVHVLGASSYL